ncbi:tetratricopeptide repeat protein [Thiocystis violacea]|uniref:tetratricopeptide repeat protein n=1 Tax=Thiocystis violacea TaxID=13725 RepID=UPI001905F7E0|nr:tetratricopeptide repeat protein [Thiocystis violacea]MBK1722777.1 hypothetical protein [Thiocystis violacea]
MTRAEARALDDRAAGLVSGVDEALLAPLKKLVRKELALKRVDKAIWAEVRAASGGDRARVRAAYFDARARKLLDKLAQRQPQVSDEPAAAAESRVRIDDDRPFRGDRIADAPSQPPNSAVTAPSEQSLPRPEDADAKDAWWPAIIAPLGVTLMGACAVMVSVHLKQPGSALLDAMEAERASALRDDDRTLLLWGKGAEEGVALAQLRLGLMYQDGRGVAQDYATAAYWYEQAAEQNAADAQFYLAELYQAGLGVPADERQAAYWYARAGEQYRLAAERGDIQAQVSLAGMYEIGCGVEQDQRTALSWYRRAAAQGDVAAQLQVGWMYCEGMGTAVDDEQAAAWYRRAAEQGSAEAQVRLAFMYEHGIGVPKDRAQAEHWYLAAAQQTNFDAHDILQDLAGR